MEILIALALEFVLENERLIVLQFRYTVEHSRVRNFDIVVHKKRIATRPVLVKILLISAELKRDIRAFVEIRAHTYVADIEWNIPIRNYDYIMPALVQRAINFLVEIPAADADVHFHPLSLNAEVLSQVPG